MSFRSKFKIDKEKINWFPGHMSKGLKQMQHKLKSVDLIIEVHDARIPFSGRNQDFKYKISGIKPHILVLNKIDTIEKSLVRKITERLRDNYPHVVYTNCKDHLCQGVKGLFPLARTLITSSDRFNRENIDEFSIMIIGVPNVGKSSLVNTLRNRFLRKPNASPVGAIPGITRSVLTKIKICENPLFYMLDTPGVLQPSISSMEDGLKLALCNCLQDHLVGEEVIAEYLLYWLNLHNNITYVKLFDLKEPTDDILVVLAGIALKYKKSLKLRHPNGYYVVKPDINAAAKIMLNSFRNAELGKIMLDIDCLNS